MPDVFLKLQIIWVFIIILFFVAHKIKNNCNEQQVCAMAISERNMISKMYNDALQKIGKTNCNSGSKRTAGGGYCGRNVLSHLTDFKLINFLKVLLKNKKVASFGEGIGTYRKHLVGHCLEYDAYDGAPDTDVASNYTVKFLDFSVPQFGLPLYNIIISLEVGEHIPFANEQIFLDNLVRYAREGIILSWAPPGQGGYEHINNRPFDYIKKQMIKRSFVHDEVISEILKNHTSFHHLKNNINYFSKQQH